MSKEMDVTQIRTCTLSNRIPTFQGCFTLLGCTLCPILWYEESCKLKLEYETLKHPDKLYIDGYLEIQKAKGHSCFLRRKIG